MKKITLVRVASNNGRHITVEVFSHFELIKNEWVESTFVNTIYLTKQYKPEQNRFYEHFDVDDVCFMETINILGESHWIQTEPNVEWLHDVADELKYFVKRKNNIDNETKVTINKMIQSRIGGGKKDD